MLYTLGFTDHEFFAGFEISVLRIRHADDRDLRNRDFPVFLDALEGITEGRDDDGFQIVINAAHTELNIRSHNGTAEALKVFVGKLDFCAAAPHADRYAARRVDDFIRRMNREASD